MTEGNLKLTSVAICCGFKRFRLLYICHIILNEKGIRRVRFFARRPIGGILVGQLIQFFTLIHVVCALFRNLAPRLRYQPFSPALLFLALFHKLPWCSMEFSWHARGFRREKFKMEFLGIGAVRATSICLNSHIIVSRCTRAYPVQTRIILIPAT